MGEPRPVQDRVESPDRLAESLRALLPLLRTGRPRPPAPDDATRLDYLEQELREVRTRVNALFFSVLAVALGELAGRLVLP